MGKIFYIGWYIADKDKGSYSGNVPGNLKMQYVSKKIQESGHQLVILSLADNIKKKVYSNYTHFLDPKTKITYFAGCSKSLFKGYLINTWIKRIELVLYVLFVVHPSDTIIIYHSDLFTGLLAYLKKIVNRRMVCEVEEIYGFSASGDDWNSVDREFKSIKKFDSFILINDYLRDELEISHSNYVPCYGVVNIPKRRIPRCDDGFIHVVYAGTIEGRKKGAYQAVEAAEFLPPTYKMHILGFGKEENISALNDKIDEINVNKGFNMIVYDGFKSGDELDQYLYACHIGISTYVMRETFANHSLPSKIFTYMCHDLAVVRGFAPAYEGTEIAKNWTFYYEDTPQDVAKAIMDAKIPPIGQNESFLRRCDKRLVDFLAKIAD